MAVGYAKTIEKAERSLLKRTGTESSIKLENIWYAVVRPQTSLPSSKHTIDLRKGFNKVLKRVDSEWSELEENNKVQLTASDLPPEFAQSIRDITLVGKGEKQKGGPPERIRIHTPQKAGVYTTETMLDALRISVQKKCARYTKSQFPSGGGCYLLIHYDEAWAYCSPILDPLNKPESHAKKVAASLKADPVPFAHAFLYIGLHPGSKAFDLM